MTVQVLGVSEIKGVPSESYIVLSAFPEELGRMAGSRWRVCASIADPASFAQSGKAPGAFYVLSALTSERTGNDRTVCAIQAGPGSIEREVKDRLFESQDLCILDVPGYYTDRDVLARMEALRTRGTLHVLGSYPLVVEL